MSTKQLTINDKLHAVVTDRQAINVSWQVDFTQYRYEVNIYHQGKALYFKSKFGNENTHCVEGLTLKPSCQYHVEVVVYGDAESFRVFTNSFMTGNFGRFQGRWISNGHTLNNDSDYYTPTHNVWMKKTLEIEDAAESAYIHLVGLGYYTLYINGQRVSEYQLNNDWSNYDKVVYYDTFDITRYLKPGTNYVAVELANGWYNPAPLTLFGKYNLRDVLAIGEPKLLADIVIHHAQHQQVISTDDSWQVVPGAYLANNMYLGERVDLKRASELAADLTLNHQPGKPATLCQGPEGSLIPSFIDKIALGKNVEAFAITELGPKHLMVDFGETVSGFIDAQFYSDSTQQVSFLYSEERNLDGRLNTDSTLAGFVGKQVSESFVVPGGAGAPERAAQLDACLPQIGKNRFINQYCYHSFRYVEIKGIELTKLEHIQAFYAHTQLREVGHFECSNYYLNDLYQIAKTTKLNNIHSVIEDCARERLAYGGDMVALADSQVLMFDSATLYQKTLADFVNDVRDNGGFPETAPFMGIKSNGTGEGAGPLGWQLAVPYLLKMHHRHYGNQQLIEQWIPSLEAQFSHLESIGLPAISECCLGDWGSSTPSEGDYKQSSPARAFTASCFYYYHAQLLAEFEQCIGRSDKADGYQIKANNIKQQIKHLYRNPDGSYADKSQTSYIFAIYFELEPELQPLIDELLNVIERNHYILTCGIFGQSFIYQLANKIDVNAVIYKWLYQKQGISHMLKDNNRALKEFFGDNNNGSCNHAMFSSYVSWLYRSLGGIHICDDAIGANKVLIKPYFASDISHVSCCYQSMKGLIHCEWKKENEKIHLSLSIPHNMSQCTLVIPEKYKNSICDINFKLYDEKHIQLDITDIRELNLKLNSVLVH
ncbi:family 78 glycoside hydrolase catalytic domain [Vibrio olivae]|uniref:alpha-L-rhamnosidase n=1 Tax=Vibrio olivae TaxID=1243002 RepID=A0ABV5HRF1_9VIBR